MIRLATVGTGWIVGEFLKGVREAGGICYTACYSRDQQRGEAFAEEWGAQKVYTDLAQMAADEEIDAVYIASPNRLHYEQSNLFLQHGKHVICEKPITVEPEELQELQELAQQNYDISDTQTLTAAGQEYTVIQFAYQDKSNPYAFGVAAFGQKGTSAIEWELSCQESYTGDALAVLTEFLNGCTY